MNMGDYYDRNPAREDVTLKRKEPAKHTTWTDKSGKIISIKNMSLNHLAFAIKLIKSRDDGWRKDYLPYLEAQYDHDLPF